jgi:hypothetical protein
MSDLTATANLLHELEGLIAAGSPADGRVTVTRGALRKALERFIAGEVTAHELVSWASLLEAHDRIEYEQGFEKVIADVLFSVASPQINEPLSATSCYRLVEQLEGK